MSLTANMATRKQPTLTEVIQAYASGLTSSEKAKSQMELEVRVPHNQYLTADWLNIWRGAYNRILARYQEWISTESKESWITSVECSVRMIDGSGQGNRILQAEYTGTTLNRRIGITKQNVISTLYDGFKVSLSKETEGSAEQFEKISPTLIRLRMRVSFQIPSLADWRIDFTYVASTENPSAFNSFLTDVRKSFLPKIILSPTNFMELVIVGPGTSPELEIEWVRRDRPPTEAEIQNGIRSLRQIVWETQTEGNEYSMVIRWLAKILERNLKDKSTLKQISNNPIGLSLNTYVNVIHPNLGDYYLTDKADGERAFLVVCPRDRWPKEFQTSKEHRGGVDPAAVAEILGRLRLERRSLEDDVVKRGAGAEDALIAKTNELLRLEEILDSGEPMARSNAEALIVGGNGETNITSNDDEEDFAYLSEEDESVSGGGKKPAVIKKAIKKAESAYVSYLVTSTLKPIDVIRLTKATSLNGVTIIDLEYIPASTNRKDSKDGLFAFDILMFNDADITEEPMSVRLQALEEAVEILKIEPKAQFRLDKDPETKIRKAISHKPSTAAKYHIDGLIFTHNGSSYWKSDSVYKMKPPDRLTIDFLMMRAPVQMMNAAPYVPRPGYTMYLLFSGINQDKMRQYGISTSDLPHYRELFQNFRGAGRIFPVHFTTPTHKLAYIYYHPSPEKASDKKKLRLKDTTQKDEAQRDELHRHVGEFIWIPSHDARKSKDDKLQLLPGMVPWSLVKLRADKDANVEDGLAYGNSYTTALDTFNDILHPLTYTDLTKPPAPSEDQDSGKLNSEKSEPSQNDPDAYFAKSKGMDYQPTTNFNNFSKAQPMQQLSGATTVIDLMCGKGQDLFKYIGYGMKNLICIDKDMKALDELRTRFRDHVTDPFWYTYPPMPQKPGVNLHVMEYDMSKDLPGLSKRLVEEHMLSINLADGVICNLGLHYIVDSEVSLKSFIKFLDATLRIGGKFIYTGFNGQRLFQMLSGLKKSEQWTSEKGKYVIRRDYTEKTIGYGLKISVLHPFSNGELYEENLMPNEMIVAALAKAGYMLVQRGSFQDFWGRYEQLGRGLAERLSPEDRFYSSLYQYSTFVRLSL